MNQKPPSMFTCMYMHLYPLRLTWELSSATIMQQSDLDMRFYKFDFYMYRLQLPYGPASIIWNIYWYHIAAADHSIVWFQKITIPPLRKGFAVWSPSPLDFLKSAPKIYPPLPPTKWRLRNERRSSILMMCHYQDLGSASDCLYCWWNLLQPIRSTTQIWVVMHHQYGISVLVSQTAFHRETFGGVAKCRLFSQAKRNGRFSLPQNNSAMTDLLIYVDNTVSCLVIFISVERDVMLKKFWPDILMEQVQEVLDFEYKLTQLIDSKWVVVDPWSTITVPTGRHWTDLVLSFWVSLYFFNFPHVL